MQGASNVERYSGGGDVKDSLVINAGVNPAPGWEKLLVAGEASGKVESTTGFTASRGNVITIEMYNTACIPTGTLGFDKPDKVAAVGKAVVDWTSMSPIGKESPPSSMGCMLKTDPEERKRCLKSFPSKD